MYARAPSDPHGPEAELVSRAGAGDPRAFRELVERYQGRIYNVVLGFVGEPDDADDVAQDVFIKAYAALRSFRGQSQFYTWLYRIAMNACMDWAKSRSRRQDGLQRVLEESRESPASAGLFSTPLPPDARVSRREARGALYDALGRLQEEFRAAIVLRELEGLTYEEISETLDCSVGTVKSRLFRARAQLKRLLEDSAQDLT